MQSTQQTVLITCGATGIGCALARKFHQAGNQVILVGRSAAALATASTALPGAQTCVADVSSAQDRARLASDFPQVTVLVNNAGIQFNGPISELGEATIEQELTVNFLAPVLLAKAFIPVLCKHPQAAIINVSSGLALVPNEIAAIYCASKAALHSFSKTLRWQLESTPVRVFEVLPPLVETAMTAGRGKGKITPQQLAEEFWDGYRNDQWEMFIGKAKLLRWVNRLAPKLAEKILRTGV